MEKSVPSSHSRRSEKTFKSTVMVIPFTVKEFQDHDTTVAEETCFVTEMESYYACDPGVSNFPEEFVVIVGHSGLHLTTLVPIADVPYSLEGHPTLEIVGPLDGPDWLPAKTGSFSPGSYSKTTVGMVGHLDLTQCIWFLVRVACISPHSPSCMQTDLCFVSTNQIQAQKIRSNDRQAKKKPMRFTHRERLNCLFYKPLISNKLAASSILSINSLDWHTVSDHIDMNIARFCELLEGESLTFLSKRNDLWNPW